MNYGIIDTATNRLVSFSNLLVAYPGCHCIELEHDLSLIGKKLEDGQWVSSNEAYVSEHAKFMESILPRTKTAEEWLSSQGYSSMRLVTLLDLENQLSAVLGSSPKLTAVRAWINGILATFIQNPAPRADWPPAPFTFEETTQEAWLAL